MSISKKKAMLLKTPKNDKQCRIYNNDPMEIGGSFKYHVAEWCAMIMEARTRYDEVRIKLVE